MSPIVVPHPPAALYTLPPETWLRHDLYVAYYQARQNKRNTINQLKFELHLEENLESLLQDILTRRYELLPGIAFVITDPKVREIFAATFRDRIVHHLVYNYIVGYWERRFIYDSYSCRPDKGTHFGISRIAHFMRVASANFTQPAWIMKLDISGYFMHMRRDLVWQLCQKMLADPHYDQPAVVKNLVAYLLPIIIFADPTNNVHVRGSARRWSLLPHDKSLFHAPPGRGFPIGNLTSQLFSNIYLNQLDQFVKRDLRIKYYGRYVDDFIIIHRDKTYLLQARDQIDEFLRTRLGLHLHPGKQYLQPVTHGVNFVGAQIYPDQIIPSHRLNHNLGCFLHNHALCDQDNSYEASVASFAGHIESYERML